ncbi:hypothetical protein AVEN_270821-1 [Araneus ventricosus]|uniref:HAT C-terminal dimerisation domain-containing protein n=1 Tax=Araneus ventricosus TaxID=182803 RepID=A0A4Y2JRH1_ARAVE|nr:hypothetical protein AVEN_270821-1 [Araneus ventricosus]
MCEKHEVPTIISRTNKRQIDRSNVDITDPESHYRISIFLPVLDTMITEIQNRFIVYKYIISFFSCLVSGSRNISDFDILVKFYKEDLLENGAFITTEYFLWKSQMSEFPDTKSSVNEMLNIEKEVFPNVHEIFAAIPVTIATLERRYNTLRRVKTYLRNITGECGLTAVHL